MTEGIPAEGMEYRHSKYYLGEGIFGALIFGSVAIVLPVVALLNPGGSFHRPVAAAVTCGLICSFFAGVGCWIIVAYLRHRLFVTREFVRVTDCFRTREVRLASVTHAVWRLGGVLVLHETNNSAKILFENYTYQEQVDLIQFFRTALAEDTQDGWKPFESRCIPVTVDYEKLKSKMHRTLRFSVIAFGVALPVMYALLIWMKLMSGAGGNWWGSWVVLALVPIGISGAFLGMMWWTACGDVARAKEREPSR